VAYQITDILSDNLARAAAFGMNSVLNIPNHQVAVKTGTTNNLRDNWTFGYTPKLLIAVWVGNNDNTPMSHVASGVTGASKIWHDLIEGLLTEDPNYAPIFVEPSSLNKVAICTLTGSLACNGCPSRDEYFIPGTEPQDHCSSEQIAKILHPENPNPTPATN
jgi:penicillin-binding protein 1C